MCLIGFKVFNNLSPGYLTQHFSKYEPTTAINLRQVGRDSYMFQTELSDYKTKNILSGIKIEWNKLPIEIRKQDSLDKFKKQLKTFLYKVAFD